MSYKTLEVELENGVVHPTGAETLPAKASALLTILDSASPNGATPLQPPAGGLNRLLSSPDFALTPEQFRASMKADFWEQ